MKIKNILFSLLISTFFVLPVQAEDNYLSDIDWLNMFTAEDQETLVTGITSEHLNGLVESMRLEFIHDGQSEDFARRATEYFKSLFVES
jgi:hypothetical protein